MLFDIPNQYAEQDRAHLHDLAMPVVQWAMQFAHPILWGAGIVGVFQAFYLYSDSRSSPTAVGLPENITAAMIEHGSVVERLDSIATGLQLAKKHRNNNHNQLQLSFQDGKWDDWVVVELS